MSTHRPAATLQAFAKHAAGCMRVALYLTLAGALLGVWSLRRVLAQTELSMSRSGEQLARELGPQLIGQPQTLSLNDQRLVFASRQSPLEPHEVLERFAQHCSGGTGDSPERVLSSTLPRQRSAREGLLLRLLDASSQWGVLRRESSGEGQLVCFARSSARAGLDKLAEDVRAFVQEGDFARLGDLRYVTARKLENGKTHVLVVWSEGPLRLGALFPASGDAPGSDMRDVPRPPASTRQFCALGFGHSYGLRMYAARGSREQLLAFYASELPKRGWRELHALPGKGDLGGGVLARAYLKDDQALALAIEPQPGGEMGVSLIDLGSVKRTDTL